MQRRGELPGERASIEAQITKLHHRKSTLETEHTIKVEFTNARARARDIIAAINREGARCPTFARTSQNMVMAAALLDTLPAPSTNRVDKVYCQLKDILSITTVQPTESSL
jgi:hypothetical protein